MAVKMTEGGVLRVLVRVAYPLTITDLVQASSTVSMAFGQANSARMLSLPSLDGIVVAPE